MMEPRFKSLIIEEVSSRRRNPYIADIFHRLDYVERRGSGLKKIQDETKLLFGYTNKYAPKFLSSRTDFRMVLMNLNFTPQDTPQDTSQDTPQDTNTIKILTFCRI